MHMVKCDGCGAIAKTSSAWVKPNGWNSAHGAKLEHLCVSCSRVIKAAITAALKKIRSRK
jgi:hypothetical protein